MQYGVEIEADIDLAGDPFVIANFVPDGSLATASWSICPPPAVSRCVDVPSRDGVLRTAREPAGTVFVATADYGGRQYRSQITWTGTVHPTRSPRVNGRARFGAAIAPVAASWAGGWRSDWDQLGIEACRTRSATHCVMVSGGLAGCPDPPKAVIESWLTGWYLFALDWRMGAGACAGVGYYTIADFPTWPVARTVARSAPVGPVAGPPAPTVRVLRAALVRRRRLLDVVIHVDHARRIIGRSRLR